MMTDFQKYASLSQGISPMTLGRYTGAVNAYLNPSIIEERKLNCASMDVFSRLMMDRIIFLGVPIDDDVANIVQAQLLYLASVDDKADISLYLNTPGGVVTSGLGIYDTMQLIAPGYDMHRHGRQHGQHPPLRRCSRQAFRSASLTCDDPPASRRCEGTGVRHPYRGA